MGPLFLGMGPLKGRWHKVASTYQLMALGLALQLLVVVKGEAIQHGVLLLVHRGHGALLVDLVNVDLLLALQDGIPPVLIPLVQADLGTSCGSANGRAALSCPGCGWYPCPAHSSMAGMQSSADTSMVFAHQWKSSSH